jgi:hypothetical protein
MLGSRIASLEEAGVIFQKKLEKEKKRKVFIIF